MYFYALRKGEIPDEENISLNYLPNRIFFLLLY